MHLIIGCGDVGSRLAGALARRGERVCGVVRSAPSARRLASGGIEAQVCDLDVGSLPPERTAGALVWYMVPPQSHGDQDERLRRFLTGLSRDRGPRRIVSLSTTGVYGDCAGDWIDETREPRPGTDRARRRWHAEQALRRWRALASTEVVVLRVAAIYGPGRLPLARLRERRPVPREAASNWVNRIHVDDLVAACGAAMRQGRDGAVYNVSDGRPCTMLDYLDRVAVAASVPGPVLAGSLSADGARASRSALWPAESRRVRNHRLTHELGVVLRYPDLSSGLRACLTPGDAQGKERWAQRRP